MKQLFTIAFMLLTAIGFSQSKTDSIFISSIEEILSNSEYSAWKEFNVFKDLKKHTQSSFTESHDKIYLRVNDLIKQIAQELLEHERNNPYSEFLSQDSKLVIGIIRNPYILSLLTRYLEDLVEIDPQVQGRILDYIDLRKNEIMKVDYSEYNYSSRKPEYIKFISIQSGNDLFRLPGFFKVKKSRTFWQRNDDRDYTGSFLIEVGTDFFKLPRKRDIKSYQTILWGFDVFTPYFRDTTLFSSDTSFNPKDRPHASFQYFGWKKCGISRLNTYRWEITFKLGKIGGYTGSNFQSALHQDVSFSPRPKGWGAQIANGGRLGFSLEGRHDYQLKVPYLNNLRVVKSILLSGFYKVGTYMTTTGGGITFSNKRLKDLNQHLMLHRDKYVRNPLLKNFHYTVSFNLNYVKHNTMLEGYGICKTREKKNDEFTPPSIYTLTKSQVRPFVFDLTYQLCYTTPYYTFFYKFSSTSPELKGFGDIGIKREPGDVENMNIAHRWHHFGVIGLVFNIL